MYPLQSAPTCDWKTEISITYIYLQAISIYTLYVLTNLKYTNHSKQQPISLSLSLSPFSAFEVKLAVLGSFLKRQSLPAIPSSKSKLSFSFLVIRNRGNRDCAST